MNLKKQPVALNFNMKQKETEKEIRQVSDMTWKLKSEIVNPTVNPKVISTGSIQPTNVSLNQDLFGGHAW